MTDSIPWEETTREIATRRGPASLQWYLDRERECVLTSFHSIKLSKIWRRRVPYEIKGSLVEVRRNRGKFQKLIPVREEWKYCPPEIAESWGLVDVKVGTKLLLDKPVVRSVDRMVSGDRVYCRALEPPVSVPPDTAIKLDKGDCASLDGYIDWYCERGVLDSRPDAFVRELVTWHALILKLYTWR